MKKETNNAYTSGILSALLILFLLAFITVFPNLWDNLAFELNPVIFKAVPLIVLIFSICIIFCIYEGISFAFYIGRKKNKTGLKYCFHFFSVTRFIRFIRLYLMLTVIRAVLFLAVFLPSGLIFGVAVMFYKNACPVEAVVIMSIAFIASLIIALRLYGEINSLFFLSKYIFFENEKQKIKDIITESYRRMKGKGGKIRRLRQSFFLPAVSCVLLVPIPFVLTNYKYELTGKVYELMK